MTTNRKMRIVLAVAALVVVALVAGGVIMPRGEPALGASIAGSMALGDTSGFRRATSAQSLSFPADYGPHPDYQTEWWYYTGNLEDGEGNHFGYQLTIFRRAAAPPDQRRPRQSEWATDQVYMAHFALTDVAAQNHRAFERLARGGAGLAGAVAQPYRVWLEDWRVEEIDADTTRLQASADGIRLDLTLKDLKGPVLHGDQGYSQKGPDPGNASYYYSLTRLDSQGVVAVGDETYPVTGLSWKDHEYSTRALAPNQVGWDWFALQLDDGSELKVFHIRQADGQIDPYSAGSFIDADGNVTPLARDQFSIAAQGVWRSPHSGAEYPARWTVAIPSLDMSLTVEPFLADQELNVSYSYWEGAVQVAGQRQDLPVRGSGYVELTGYAGSMQGQF
jgi:predicted secreted hydrolase